MKEDDKTEFKSSFSEATIESLVAFANVKGGKVVVGVDDKGIPVNGFTIGRESLQKWINEVKTKTQPSIIPDAEIIKINGKEVVCLKINEFPVKPVSFRGRYFKRVNNSNHQLSVIEIAELSLESLQISWDSYPANGISITDLDLKKVDLFIEKVNGAGRFILEGSALESLEKLRLV